MSRRYDVAIVGGGHNGLTAAAYLAKKGCKVVVCESRPTLGGLGAGEEFHPGFRTAGVLDETCAVRSWVVEELDLAQHGLVRQGEERPIAVLEPGGPGLMLWRSAEATHPGLADRAPKDAESYARYREFLDGIAPVVRRLIDSRPPDLERLRLADLWAYGRAGVAARLLGRRTLMELLRIGPMALGDWLREWFGDELLKAALAAPAIHHSFTGPWSPGTTFNLLVHETLAGPPVVGGGAALVRALEAAASGYGAELRPGARVEAIDVDGGAVRGLVLGGGETVQADRVLAAIDPRHLLFDLLPVATPSLKWAHGMRVFRSRGTAARLDLALSRYPSAVGSNGARPERLRIGGTIDDLERAFDAVKYGAASERPLLELSIPTVGDPKLAPEGQHVLSVLSHFVPYEPRRDADGAGWTDMARQRLADTILARLEEHLPGVTGDVIGQRLLTPLDLERDYGAVGGHLQHGELALDQIVIRPTPETLRYDSPVEGLYLGSSGSHPGGGLTCAPGALAAKAILADGRRRRG